MEAIPFIFIALFFIMLGIALDKDNKVLTTEEIQTATAYCESQGLSVKTHPHKRREGYVNDVSCRDGNGNLYTAEY